MDSFKQLLCIVISFGYGILLGFVYYLLNKFVKKKNLLFRILLFIISIVLLAILYVYVIYKVNYGIINVYFYVLMASGFILFNVKKRKI